MSKASGASPQGCRIQLYGDGEAEAYELHSIRYELLPTGVAVCTYNTPKSLNCLSQNQIWEMFALLEHMARDDAVLVAVWTGAGRGFNSGKDFKDPVVQLPARFQAAMRARGAAPDPGHIYPDVLTKAFWDFPKPSIVAVNGLAVGGGANLALMNCHDLVYCSSAARFQWPFAKMGIVPEVGSSMMMPLLIGTAKTKELNFLGEWLPAAQAKELGLVNDVVEPEQLMPRTLGVAEQLVLKHPTALRLSKRLINLHLRPHITEAVRQETAHFLEAKHLLGSPKELAKWTMAQEAWFKEVKAKL